MNSWKKTKNRLADILKIVSSTSFIFLLIMPYSTNYKLKDYGFGSGGTSNSTSGSYAATGIAGDVGGGKETSSPYALGPGLMYDTQANVPTAPTFTNPSSYYNKLHIVINTASNPTDTKYAIAISTDNFVTITNYVQSDNTVGAVLGAEDYQLYTAWGSGAGVDIIGLTANTTYQVKVKAMQGKFTETAYGPTASVATVNPTLSFGITTDLSAGPTFSVNFGNMTPGAINSSSPHQVNVTLDTNGASGGRVYVSGANGGLYSTVANHKITAISADLTGQTEGFGMQGISGGTLTLAAPYDQVGTTTVGIVDTTVRNIFYTAGPISGGTGSFLLKSKPSATAPAANDYAETLTVVASGSF